MSPRVDGSPNSEPRSPSTAAPPNCSRKAAPHKAIRGGHGDRLRGAVDPTRLPRARGVRVRLLRLERPRSSPRAIRQAWLVDLIREIHVESFQVYGSPRVHAELTLGRGITVGHNTIALLMRRNGIKGLPNRRHPRPSHDTPTAVDLVDRDFARTAPNRLWVTDITEHPTRVGKVYCAVVLDVHSLRVVGWSIDSSQTAALATNALGMAISNRSPLSDTMIHSGHGVQFTSWTFTRRAKESGLLPSMGSIGDCYDTQSMP
ncbi:IS3 family transposase [Saccharothrix sp. BKS2]|uniref:IS3 family transposase n=1 Tax=Saccharothrix sp. BKS2 TaxID=3064400 RepID=UPI0039EB84BA